MMFISYSTTTNTTTTHIFSALDGEVSDEHEGHADGTHHCPDELLARIELAMVK
jgi:hypothetical protein